MAEDKNVFDAYCGCLMLKLKEIGYLQHDYNLLSPSLKS